MLILYILGQIFLLLLLILLLVLLAILLIPYRYHFAGEKFDCIWFRLQVSWLFGGVKLQINYDSENIESAVGIFGINRNIKRRPEKEEKHKNKDKHEDKPEKGGKSRRSLNSYLNRQVLEKAMQCLIKLLKHCKPVKFELNAKAGFDDPMYTGLLCGLQGTCYAISDKYNVRIQTSFEEEELEGALTIAGRFYLVYLILAAIEFLISKPFRTAYVKNKKLKNKGD